jgi:PAS domain S-box-containing protein
MLERLGRPFAGLGNEMSEKSLPRGVKLEAKGTREPAGTGSKTVRRTNGPTRETEQPTAEIDEHRRIEDELEESERDLAEAQRVARVGNWKWAIEKDEVSWSTELFRILGYDPESDQPSRNAFLDRVHPEDRPLVEGHIATLVSEGEPFSIDHRIVLPDGSTRFLLSMARIERGPENGPMRLFGVAQDITERKRSEEELKLKDSAIESSISGIAITDLEGRLVYVNDSLVRMWGFDSRQEILGRFLPEFWDGDGIARTVDDLRAQGSSTGEDIGRKKDGSLFPVEYSASMLTDVEGNPVNMYGSFVDISYRKRAEERYVLASVAGRVGVWDWDLKTDDMYVDPELKGLLGYEDHEIRNHIDDWGSKVHPDDVDLVMAEATKHLDGVTERYEVEHRMLHKDGSIRWFLARGTALRDDEGQPFRMAGTDTDITEQKQAREALADLGGRLINAQEEERSRIARELHDDVSQRLALLAVELEYAAETFSESGPELVEKIGEFLPRFKELSSDIHDLSYRLHPRSLERLGLTVAIRSLCREISERRRIQLVFEEKDIPDSIPDDAALCLYRVAQESLRNVVNHSRAESASVELSAGDDEVRLTVMDSGVGYDPDQIRERNGLGVISMRERLRAIGGRLSIRSAPGEGTTVEAAVPLVES